MLEPPGTLHSPIGLENPSMLLTRAEVTDERVVDAEAATL
jgi:hypothetical protein